MDSQVALNAYPFIPIEGSPSNANMDVHARKGLQTFLIGFYYH